MEKKEEKDSNKVILWIKDHKRGIGIGVAVTAVSVVGGIIIYKNWDSIKEILPRGTSLDDVKEAFTVKAVKTPQIVIPQQVALTGIKKTATELGYDAYTSAQKINKKLIEAGLAERMPDGTLSLTDLGTQFGEYTTKVRASGYEFTNIEWDDSVLGLILTEEEMARIEKLREELKPIHDFYKDYHYTWQK